MSAEARLAALAEAVRALPSPRGPERVNCHIHSFFSFSPYSPSAAALEARRAGVRYAGLIDHDTLAGAGEFLAACKICGISGECGFEVRVDMRGGFAEGLMLNDPHQRGVAYMTLHGIRPENFPGAETVLSEIRRRRGERNRKMTILLSAETGVPLDYERDVLPLSHFYEGGAVTERHLLYALVLRMLPEGASEAERYSLLGRFKKELLPKIYIDAGDELLSLSEAAALARDAGALLCYCYLGDVRRSPTGDKSAAEYEDAYLDRLLEALARRGVGGVDFSPTRNTPAQLERLMRLCKEYALRPVCGEDVNSPSQSFACARPAEALYPVLLESARALTKKF